MPRSRLNHPLGHPHRRWVLLALALCIILAIALIDGRVDPFISIGFVAAGLFVSDVLHTRATVLRHGKELKQSILLRQDAEEQLRLIVATSPARLGALGTNIGAV